MVTLGPSLKRLGRLRGSAGLGLLFGLNIPACAAPLLLALLAGAATTGATLLSGFVALAVFGLALSLPLVARSEEHTSELQSLMRISYAVFCLKKKKHIRLQTS